MKLETENGNNGSDVIMTEKEKNDDAKDCCYGTEQVKAAPKHGQGVFYCPLQRDAGKIAYEVNMQKLFSPEHYDKKQLLCSMECKIYSRLDDLFYSRNKIRAKLVEEEGWKHVLDDTEQFCAFESQVTNVALSDVVMMRPADYNVIEPAPVMEFHAHVSLINNIGDVLVVEVEMENDRKEKTKKSSGFSDRFVGSFRSLLMKIVKHFPN